MSRLISDPFSVEQTVGATAVTVVVRNRNSWFCLFKSEWLSVHAIRASSAICLSHNGIRRPMQSPDLKTFPRLYHISNRHGRRTCVTASLDTCPPSPNVPEGLHCGLPVLASADKYFKAPLILSGHISNQMESSPGLGGSDWKVIP